MSTLGTESILTPFTWDKVNGFEYTGIGSNFFKNRSANKKDIEALKTLETALLGLDRNVVNFKDDVDDLLDRSLRGFSNGVQEYGKEMAKGIKAGEDITGSSEQYARALKEEKNATFVAKAGQVALNAVYSSDSISTQT